MFTVLSGVHRWTSFSQKVADRIKGATSSSSGPHSNSLPSASPRSRRQIRPRRKHAALFDRISGTRSLRGRGILFMNRCSDLGLPPRIRKIRNPALSKPGFVFVGQGSRGRVCQFSAKCLVVAEPQQARSVQRCSLNQIDDAVDNVMVVATCCSPTDIAEASNVLLLQRANFRLALPVQAVHHAHASRLRDSAQLSSHSATSLG